MRVNRKKKNTYVEPPDLKTVVTVPRGAVTTKHINEIVAKINQALKRDYTYYTRGFLTRNPDWVVNGSTLPKRLGTYLRQGNIRPGNPKQKEDLTKALSDIGAKYGPLIKGDTTYNVWLKKQMDWRAGEFGDKGSCFWGCYQNHRMALNGSHRFYAVCIERAGKKGRVLTWRFDDHTWVLFNAYGYPISTFGRILSAVLGWKVKTTKALQSKGVFINGCYGLVLTNAPTKGRSYIIDLNVNPDFDADDGECHCEQCERGA